MHPLIARFLDLKTAVDALEKAEQAQPLDADETALVAAAAGNLKLRAAVLKAKGKAHPSLSSQQAVIVLACEAATRLIEKDEGLGPRVSCAVKALEAEGASADEAHQLIAGAVLEESFGGANTPDAMDRAWLEETFDSLVPLSKVSTDLVDDWVEAFAKKGDAGQKALRLKVAETLLNAAWGEGPQPITAEHVDDALELLSSEVASSELERTSATLIAFLTFLATKGVVGSRRLARLAGIVKTTPLEGADEADDEADEEEADEAADEAEDE